MSGSQACDESDAIHWFWLSKVREECPSYWCLVDPTSGRIVHPLTATAADTTSNTITPTTPTSLTADDVLTRCISLIESHWDTWTPQRLTSTLTGKVVVVGVQVTTSEVMCMGVLDIPVRFQHGGRASSQPVPPTSSSPSHVLQLATATFVIVAPAARGMGLGKKLMDRLEEACERSHLTPSSPTGSNNSSSLTDPPAVSEEVGVEEGGDALLAVLGKKVDGISLRTDTQVAFYEACGYRRGRTQQLISERACFQKVNLKQNQLDGLTNLFAARGVEAQRRIATAADEKNNKPSPGEETSSKPAPLFTPPAQGTPVMSMATTNNNTNTSVWMLKIVREEAPEPFTRPLLPLTLPTPQTAPIEDSSKSLPAKGWNLTITDAANNSLITSDVTPRPTQLPLEFVLPWQRQIGPSCGLALLRMVREYILDEHHQQSSSTHHSANTTTPAINPSSRASILASLPSLSDLYLSLSSSTPDYYVEFVATADGDARSMRQPPALGEVLHAELLKCVGERYLQSLLLTTTTTTSRPPSLLFEVVPIETLLNIEERVCVDEKRDDIRNGGLSSEAVWYAVPYDRSSSETPSTTQGGQRAHWGMVVGAVTATTTTMVLLQHGASPDAVLTTVEELVASNQQLRQVAVTCQETGETRQACLSGLRGSCVRIRFMRCPNSLSN